MSSKSTKNTHYSPKEVKYCPIDFTDWEDLKGKVKDGIKWYSHLKNIFPIVLGGSISFLTSGNITLVYWGLPLLIIGIAGTIINIAIKTYDSSKVIDKIKFIDCKISKIIKDQQDLD